MYTLEKNHTKNDGFVKGTLRDQRCQHSWKISLFNRKCIMDYVPLQLFGASSRLKLWDFRSKSAGIPNADPAAPDPPSSKEFLRMHGKRHHGPPEMGLIGYLNLKFVICMEYLYIYIQYIYISSMVI